uniref:Uncharacterized protein n=1 Tax=Anopheles melas TaxID=34690 RepID=A0A182TQR1_9DIPT
MHIFKRIETPSISKVRPLITPASLQISSRGRVVFSIVPATGVGGQQQQHEQGQNASAPPDFGTSEEPFLSPEYINSLGKNVQFSESDVEKVRTARPFAGRCKKCRKR